MSDIGIGYTLATGRLFCDISVFHEYAERLLGEPIYTHEFADEATWNRLRAAFEAQFLAEAESLTKLAHGLTVIP